MAGWEIVPLHDWFPSIGTMRRCSAATRRAGSDHPTGALDLRFARQQPPRLDSTISIIVSQAAIVPAGIGDARLDNPMHQRRCAKHQRCSSGGNYLGVARDQFTEPATGLWSSDPETQKSGRGQRHGIECRSGSPQGESEHPSRRRHYSPRQVAETFDGAD